MAFWHVCQKAYCITKSAFSRLFPPFRLFHRIRLVDFSALICTYDEVWGYEFSIEPPGCCDWIAIKHCENGKKRVVTQLGCYKWRRWVPALWRAGGPTTCMDNGGWVVGKRCKCIWREETLIMHFALNCIRPILNAFGVFSCLKVSVQDSFWQHHAIIVAL